MIRLAASQARNGYRYFHGIFVFMQGCPLALEDRSLAYGHLI